FVREGFGDGVRRESGTENADARKFRRQQLKSIAEDPYDKRHAHTGQEPDEKCKKPRRYRPTQAARRNDRCEHKRRQDDAERIGDDRFALEREFDPAVYAYLFKYRRDDGRACDGNYGAEQNTQFPRPPDQIMRESSGKRGRYQKPDRHESEHGARRMAYLANVEHHSTLENDDRY